MQQPQSWVIREEEKDSNPIFKVVFNKIRNLRKKMLQINHIKTLDKKSLKPAQVEKLQKEEETLEEINRFEEFAKMYKSILIENNLSYDRIDDLLKVSTLLTVGKRVQAQEYCPVEVKNVYQKVYSKIFCRNLQHECKVLSDQVIRVYHLLSAYLDNDSNYSECRDYLSYIQQISERMNRQKLGKKQTQKKKHQSINIQLTNDIFEDLKKKIEKLQVTSQTIKINLDKSIQEQTSECQQKIEQIEQIIEEQKDLDLKQENSTATPEGDAEIQQLQREIIRGNSHQNSVWSKNKNHLEGDQIDFHSADNKNVINNPKNNRTSKNRQRRNRKNKRPLYTQVEFNIRKCSDTSLEPTPEKTWTKKKYMEKKQGL